MVMFHEPARTAAFAARGGVAARGLGSGVAQTQAVADKEPKESKAK